MAEPLPKILAVALPALLLGGAFWTFALPEAHQLSPAAAALDARLEREQPEFVVIGSSLASDVIVDQLEQEVPELGAGSLISIGGAPPSLWYLVLKNRVYGNGHSPKLILLPAMMFHALKVAESREPVLELLQEQRTASEPVVDAKLSGATPMPAPVANALSKRISVRQHLVDGVRDVSVGALFTSGEQPLLDRGREQAEAALGRVFATEAVDRKKYSATSFLATGGSKTKALASQQSVTGSFLPDILALAKEHGSRVVLIKVPVTSWIEGGPPLPPALEDELLTFLGDNGAGFIDLSRGLLTDDDFIDAGHPNHESKQVLTTRVARELRAIGALGDGPMARPKAPLRVESATRTPSPPVAAGAVERMDVSPCRWRVGVPKELALRTIQWETMGFSNVTPLRLSLNGVPLERARAFGELTGRCLGRYFQVGPELQFTAPPDVDPTTAVIAVSWDDGAPVIGPKGEEMWWVAPGSELTLAFPAPARVDGDKPFRVVATGATLQVPGTPPTLFYGEKEAAFARSGRDLWATLSGDAPTAPWTLRVSNPPDGAPVLIRTLGVGDPDALDLVLGERDAEPTQSVEFTQPSRKKAPMRFAAPPPALDVPLRIEGADGVFTAAVVGHPLAPRCAPVDILRDGQVLPLETDDCGALGPGEVCLTRGGDVRFRPQDGIDPARSWAVRLRDDRRCGGRDRSHVYLFPGDSLEAERELSAGEASVYDTLVLYTGMAGTGVPAQVRVTLRAGERLLLDQTLTPAQLRSTSTAMTLQQRVLPKDKLLTLSLTTRDGDMSVLVRNAILRGPSAWGRALRAGAASPPDAPPAEVVPATEAASGPAAPKGPAASGTQQLAFMTQPDASTTLERVQGQPSHYSFRRLPKSTWTQVCTPLIVTTDPVSAHGRARVEALQNLPGKTGAAFVASVVWTKSDGSYKVEPVLVTKKTGQWQDLATAPHTAPPGALKVTLCASFRQGTGAVELADFALTR